MIFTSGSTGRPKGAAIEHRSALHYLHGVTELVPDVYESYGVVSTIASDLVMTCLYGALVRGAAVHLWTRTPPSTRRRTPPISRPIPSM